MTNLGYVLPQSIQGTSLCDSMYSRLSAHRLSRVGSISKKKGPRLRGPQVLKLWA
jgi:hypothetical protein